MKTFIGRKSKKNRGFIHQQIPHRIHPLKGWDYRTPAWYFITICTKNRYHHFGEIRNGIMGLSEMGCIAHQNWAAIPDHFNHVKLDAWIVMPNHVHGLIGIMDWPVGKRSDADSRPHPVGTRHGVSLQGGASDQPIKFGNPKSGSISTIINQYKGSVTSAVRDLGHPEFAWQSRFHDHIVRNDRALNRIRNYIINNPLKWDRDQFY